MVAGFNTAFCRDGQAVATGSFNLGGFPITNLATVSVSATSLFAANNATVAAALAVAQWSFANVTIANTFISATSYSTLVDLTAVVLPGTRIKASVTAGTAYGVVKSATWDGTKTTFVISNLFGALPLDAGLGPVSYGILRGTQGGDAMGSCVLASTGGTQAVVGGVLTAIALGSVTQDQLGEFTASAFTPLNGGRYAVVLTINPSVTQQYNIGVYVGGVVSGAYQEFKTITAADTVVSSFQVTVPPGGAGQMIFKIQAAAGFTLGTQIPTVVNITQLM